MSTETEKCEMPRKFLVLKQRILDGETYAEVGDIVYDQQTHDYGLANEDSRITGIEHRSVTKNEDGGYPGFTISVFDIEELKE